MAATKMKSTAKDRKTTWRVSWMHLLIAASVTVNIAFVVMVITMMTSHALDGMFMNEGLSRYCSAANDSQFTDSSDKVKAFREYTCGKGDAQNYFEGGFKEYLYAKGIKG